MFRCLSVQAFRYRLKSPQADFGILMISKEKSLIVVTGDKGGAAKTTTAIHIATYLHQLAPALVIDGDHNKSALFWAEKGKLPFACVSHVQAAAEGLSADICHRIIDTDAAVDLADFTYLVQRADLLIITTPPDPLSVNALQVTKRRIDDIGGVKWRVLITMDAPQKMLKGKRSPRSRDAQDVYDLLTRVQIPVFETVIRYYRNAYTKAAAAGVPVYASKDRYQSTAWSDYLRLGKELSGE